MAVDSKFLMSHGEWFAAGFFEIPGGSPIARMSRAIRRQLENCVLPAMGRDRPLYPFGPCALYTTRHNVFTFNYSYSATCQYALRERIDQAATAEERAQWESVRQELDAYPLGTAISPRFMLGGNGYTHSIPNSGRVLAEGLDGYARRVSAAKTRALRAGEAKKIEFYDGLEDVLAGAKALHGRMVKSIEELPAGTPARGALLEAYRVVPLTPARTFFEALVALNFIFYLDGCDSLGHVDRVLGEYYRRDLSAGAITHGQAVELMRALWRNFDENSAWNVALGGTRADGSPAYDDFSLVCLEAASGMRRPNLALKVRTDMPEEHWQAALDCLAGGCGQPALYNDALYLRALGASSVAQPPSAVSSSFLSASFPMPEHQQENSKTQPRAAVPHEDVCDYAFAGCTETMVHGLSNVGSLDAGLNLLELLLETLRESLVRCATFEQLMDAYRARLRAAIAEMAGQVNRDQEIKAKYRPQMVRSLLVDDCIASGREFNAGGARYNWSVINVGGLSNVADSLAAIRELVYARGMGISPQRVFDLPVVRNPLVTATRLLSALKNDFVGEEQLLSAIGRCPKFGNDNDAVDLLAREISDFVFAETGKHTCRRGGRFLPSCLLFATYAQAGAHLSASPDGRRAGQAIADSIGPHQGRDRKGPTAMLKSVAKLNHSAALGTLVLNLRLAKTFFATPADRRAIVDLVQGYFSLGGMQVQISVIDQEAMRDAIAHPERHAGLIVRIGGYSEYFNNLSPELKQTVLERTEHTGRLISTPPLR